jgi:hypothetical protein
VADEFDRADVDAKLERSGRHQRAEIPSPEARFDPLPAFLGKAPVMSGDLVFSQALAQLMGDALRHSAGVDEDQCGALPSHAIGDAVQNLGHLLG